MKTFTLISYGKEVEYRRALFALLSFYAHLPSADYPNYRSIIWTDNPKWFSPWVAEFGVEIRELSPERIRELKGEINFNHMIKIGLLRELLSQNKEDLLFVDSDTFFTRSPAEVYGGIKAGQSVMHQPEYAFGSLHSKPCEVMRGRGQFLRDNTLLLTDGSAFQVGPDLWSWNSGVLGLSCEALPLFEDIDAMARQIFVGTRSHVSEQYAYSISLNVNTTVVGSVEQICHYFKDYEKLVMDDFISKFLASNGPSKPWSERRDAVVRACSWLPSQIPRAPLRWRWECLHAFSEKRQAVGLWFALRYLVGGGFRDWSFLRDLLYVARTGAGRFLKRLSGQGKP